MTDISVGAIGAACIGAFFTLVGLIVTKESKTSEFRESWIGDLRSEISKFLAATNAIIDAGRVTYENDAGRVAFLAPYFSDLNEATFQVSLRLNPKQADSKSLLYAMKDCQSSVRGTTPDQEKLRASEARVLSIGRRILKNEWKRVKRGEITFRVAKVLSVIAFVIFLMIAIYVSFEPNSPAAQASHSAELGPKPGKTSGPSALNQQSANAPVATTPLNTTVLR